MTTTPHCVARSRIARRGEIVALGLFFCATSAWASSGDSETSHFVFQIAIILLAAHLGGALFRRLRWPGVVGELSGGLLIGPHALGSVSWPLLGAPFPIAPGAVGGELPAEILHLSSLAAILLLFVSGLETDVGMFLRYSGPGLLVGIGGVVLAFALGAWGAVWLGLAHSWSEPTALFFGAISTATSVGITARLLSERHWMQTPEGVTILAAAVLDDILSFILLAVVVGVTQAQAQGAALAWGSIGLVAARTVAFWILLSGAGLLLGRRLARLLKQLGSHETIGFVTFGLALVLAGVSERMGLAAIIGAYTAGIALSRSDLADVIRARLHGLYVAFVPIFFCVSGMQVNLDAMRGVLLAGLAFTGLAVLSKIGGCGGAALLSGFNGTGALRVGLGMLPRGEVALIIAGLGLTQGVLSAPMYGVAVMMAILTTLLAPPLLGPLLTPRNPLRRAHRNEAPDESVIAIELPREDIVQLVLSRVVEALRSEGYLVQPLPGENTYRARLRDQAITLTRDGARLQITTAPAQAAFVRYLLVEELVELEDILEACRSHGRISEVRNDLIRAALDPHPAPSSDGNRRTDVSA